MPLRPRWPMAWRDLAEELALIEVTRSHLARILRHCDIEAFQRTGVHSEDGPMTLETLLERIVSHMSAPHCVHRRETKGFGEHARLSFGQRGVERQIGYNRPTAL